MGGWVRKEGERQNVGEMDKGAGVWEMQGSGEQRRQGEVGGLFQRCREEGIQGGIVKRWGE